MTPAACSFCNATLPAGAGQCPACGTAQVFTQQRSLAQGQSLHGGKYAIERVLGEGGFSITYRCGHRDLQRRVAVKEFFPPGAQRVGSTVVHPNQPDAFLREQAKLVQEARHLSGLRAPGIVNVYDVFHENGTAYIVMECLEGQTLEQRLAAGALPAAEVARMARVLCDALAEVHDRQLLHRDIKPANVMLTPEGRVVLIDFGSARAFQAGRTGNPTRVLTPDYAAPEQFSDRARFGPYTDIFSLGATLYHALTGAPPLPAVDRLRDPPAPVPFPSGTPAALQAALQQALALRVDDRPQHTAALRALLAPAAADADAPDPGSQAHVASRWPALPAGPWWETARENTRRWARPVAIAMGGLALVTSLYVTTLGPLQSAGGSLSVLAPPSLLAATATFTPTSTSTIAPVPTLTSTPTLTPMPTSTPTARWASRLPPSPRVRPPPTATPVPPRTPTPVAPQGVVKTLANLRAGPGTHYDIVGQLAQGRRVQPVFRTYDSLWLQLRNGNWIYAPLVDRVVAADLPLAPSIPPAPTPAPTATPRPVIVTPTWTPTATPQPQPGDWHDPIALDDDWSLPDGLTMRLVRVFYADSGRMQHYMERPAGQACRGCLALEMEIANSAGNEWEYVVQEDFQLLYGSPAASPVEQVTCDHSDAMPDRHANRGQRFGLHYGADTRYLCFEGLLNPKNGLDLLPGDIAASYRLAYRHNYFFPSPTPKPTVRGSLKIYGDPDESQEAYRRGWIVYFALKK